MKPVRLGDVAEIQLGKMLSPDARRGIRPLSYLRNANVQWNRVDIDDLSEMDFDEAEEAKFLLRPGDVLVCEGGEPGRAAVWDGRIERCCYQKALHRLRPIDNRVDPQFLVYRLWLDASRGAFTDGQTQTTIAHLPAIRLAELRLALPSLGLQQEICDELGEQFVVTRSALLSVRSQQATTQNLLRRTLTQFSAGVRSIHNARPLRTLVTAKASPSTKSDGDTVVMTVTSGCLGPAGFDEAGLRPNLVMAHDVAEGTLAPDEVLVSRSNTANLVGRAARYPGGDPVVATDLTFRLEAAAGVVDPEYLARYMAALQVEGFWLSLSSGASSTMKKITRDQLGLVQVPLPPIAEQRRIAAELRDRLATIDQMTRAIDVQLEAIEALPAALLRRAFEEIEAA